MLQELLTATALRIRESIPKMTAESEFLLSKPWHFRDQWGGSGGQVVRETQQSQILQGLLGLYFTGVLRGPWQKLESVRRAYCLHPSWQGQDRRQRDKGRNWHSPKLEGSCWRRGSGEGMKLGSWQGRESQNEAWPSDLDKSRVMDQKERDADGLLGPPSSLDP